MPSTFELHDGTSGTAKVGPSASASAVAALTEWELEIETKTKELGPFIGDPNTYTIRTGKSGKGTMKGLTPKGRDVGQTAIMDAQDSGTDLYIQLIEDSGYTYSFYAIISKTKHGQKSDEGVPFECEYIVNGPITRAATPATP